MVDGVEGLGVQLVPIDPGDLPGDLVPELEVAFCPLGGEGTSLSPTPVEPSRVVS